MKVLYDHQIFEWQRYGGVSRYFVELLRHFQAGGPVSAELALACSCNPYLRESGLAPAGVDFTTLPAVAERNRQRSLRHFLPRRKFRGKERLYRVLTALGYDQPEDIRRHQQANVRASVSRLQGGAFDVFHPTYYYPYFLPHLGDRPLVVTIHDMTHELYPEYFDLADGTLAFKRTLAERATLIIAISESTREDLIRILRVPGEKVKVVLHGHTRRPSAPASPAGAPPSLLYVGPRALYKNFCHLPHGALALQRQFDRPPLVVLVVLPARLVIVRLNFTHGVAGAALIPTGLFTKLVLVEPVHPSETVH